MEHRSCWLCDRKSKEVKPFPTRRTIHNNNKWWWCWVELTDSADLESSTHVVWWLPNEIYKNSFGEGYLVWEIKSLFETKLIESMPPALFIFADFEFLIICRYTKQGTQKGTQCQSHRTSSLPSCFNAFFYCRQHKVLLYIHMRFWFLETSGFRNRKIIDYFWFLNNNYRKPHEA